MSGVLYVVATPIGNLSDITERAKTVLCDVDIIAAEDTRITKKLLNILNLNIESKVISNHKFNEKRQLDFLVGELLGGKNIAVVSDAGTPCVSDPGSVLVHEAAKHFIDVVPVCGASSVIAALCVSGFESTSFAFYGFFPREAGGIKELLTKVNESEVPVSIFFESPNRITKTLNLISEHLPFADLCVCNDLTKKHERIYRGLSQEVCNEVMQNPSAQKGEYVIVMQTVNNHECNEVEEGLSFEAMLVDYVIKNGVTLKEAVNAVSAQQKNGTKKEFYAASLNLKNLF